MIKVLAALITSMTGGAVLLTLLEPGIGRLSSQSPLLLQASRLVGHPSGNTSETTASQTRPLREWQQIQFELVSGSLNDKDAKDLSASPAHIYLDLFGQLIGSPQWDEQSEMNGRPGVLVIRVEADPQAENLSVTQQQTLHFLLARLKQKLELPLDEIEVISHHPRITSLQLQRILADSPASAS
ncbi:MAG: hypothetical protein HJJLKODD_01683 [Phycisphaerae bacterium]|nr:hypothetical protein [Phycisphaerae bacterium]